MDYEPIAVGLKFGFIAVLYLFLLWIARSALKDLRRTASPAPDATGLQSSAMLDEGGGSSEEPPSRSSRAPCRPVASGAGVAVRRRSFNALRAIQSRNR